MKREIIFMLALCSLYACSIKEDRTECPTEFTVVFNAPDDIVGKNLDFNVLDGENSLLQDSFTYQGGWQPRVYRIPRKEEFLVASYGIEGISQVYTIAQGRQCDSIYSGYKLVHPGEEYGRDSVVLHKNFASVFVNLIMEDGDGTNPYDLHVRANSNGVTLLSDLPVSGSYSFWPYDNLSADGFRYSFRLPRLNVRDGSFSLGFCERESGKEVCTLGFSSDMLESKGYSWAKANLDDITIDLTVGATTMNISVGDWYVSAPIDITF